MSLSTSAASASSLIESLVADDGNTISVELRKSDGYVNATKLCRSAGKLFGEYHLLKSTRSLLRVLRASIGATADPIHIIKTGPNHLRGTWVHPRVATHLAMWISPSFAAKVTAWLETAKALLPAVREEYDAALESLVPCPSDQSEMRIRDRLVVELQGSPEVAGKYSRIDLVTSSEVIEIKRATKVTHALGQVLGHSVAFPHLRRRIHLFGDANECSKSAIADAIALCAPYDVYVTFEIVSEDA